MGQQNDAGSDHDQNAIEPVEDGSLFEFMVESRFKAKPLANHVRRGKRQNGGGEEGCVEQTKSE